MARERMVTRTVVTGNYEVLAVNMETLKAETVTVKIPSYDSLTEKALNKALVSAMPNNFKFVQVMDCKPEEILYGMSEQEFIKLAKALPPRTKTE